MLSMDWLLGVLCRFVVVELVSPACKVDVFYSRKGGRD